MRITIEKLSRIINDDSRSDIVRLIFDYAVLNQKLENIDTGSWYFQKAKKNNINKLKKMEEQFDIIRKDFNETSLDILIESRQNWMFKLEKYSDKKYRGLVNSLLLNSIKGQLNYVKELIRLKSKSDKLYPIDYYISNPKEFSLLL